MIITLSQSIILHSFAVYLTMLYVTLNTQRQSQSYFTTGGLPLISLGDKPLETHDQ
jgi:hypothetical protein